MRFIFTILLLILILTSPSFCQDKYDYQWLFGYKTSEDVDGTILDFKEMEVNIFPIQKNMDLGEGSSNICDRNGNLILYTDGCSIAGANHEIIENGDSISSGYIERVYCKTNGSPMTQSTIFLPKPESENHYYLFNYDLEPLYEFPVGLYTPIAPERLYYHEINLELNNGLGAVVQKKQIAIQDTFARSSIQAHRHNNGSDWWVIAPKSHSNCYHTLLLTSEGIQDSFLQCKGHIWNDFDLQAQATFSPNGKKYARIYYHNGLNIFDFDNTNGLLSNPIHIPFSDVDTFYWAGVAISPNSRFFMQLLTQKYINTIWKQLILPKVGY